MATNTEIQTTNIELVSANDLTKMPFEEILTQRLMKFKGQDYKQIADYFGIRVTSNDKSRYARVTKRILLKGLKQFDDAEEIKKAGIIVKTIRIEENGSIRESMSFENINYNEVFETEEWTDSRWYEIVTSRFMFVVYRATENNETEWENETRYVLDKVIFWTMPKDDLVNTEKYWNNIRKNVLADTLQDNSNDYWNIKDKRDFHVRPKAQKSKDKYYSPISGVEVPKKAYWFNNEYVSKIIRNAYGSEWNTIFSGK